LADHALGPYRNDQIVGSPETLGCGRAWPVQDSGLIAALSAMLGVLIERWLLFAEATHTVTLYYGASKV
jgi:hypothetical protein